MRKRRSLTVTQTKDLAFDIESFRLVNLLYRIDLPERLGVGNGTLGRIMQGIPVDKLTAAKIRKVIDRKEERDGK